MQKVLIVEDSRTTARFMAHNLKEQLGLAHDCAENRKTALALLDTDASPYFLALCDLNLPDAPNGEIVSEILARNIPVVVVSAHFDEDIYKRLMLQGVTDYIVKRTPDDMMYLMRVVRRLRANSGVEALIVDDSNLWCMQVSELLRRQRIMAYTANNGIQALRLLRKHPGIRIVLADHYMPGMDGIELTAAIRKTHTMDELSIIVISVGTDAGARFLRSGANDYVFKTSSFEELLCRISMNLDIQDLIRNNRALAERDALTNLLVRRHFFTVAQEAVAEARKKRTPLCAAMIDVDYFKQVNDRYGHLAGDIALRQLGAMLREEFPAPYICGRYGGEEFCVVAPGMDKNDFAHKLESFRTTVSSKPVQIGALSIVISVSIGMAELKANDLETLISAADAQLYTAKREGRDRFVWQP
ncbi:GGDEF domain-containing response regulator [Desulfovibrio desulfuricans]|nr:diguanylate cyclase [Desulfovibrio desulfuricans]